MRTVSLPVCPHPFVVSAVGLLPPLMATHATTSWRRVKFASRISLNVERYVPAGLWKCNRIASSDRMADGGAIRAA